MSLKPVPSSTPPELPVTIEDAKAHLRVTYSLEDSLIEKYTEAAIIWIERRCEISILEREWEWKIPSFSTPLELPISPASDGAEVSFLDVDGLEQTVPTSDYYLYDGALFPAPTGRWPANISRRHDAVRVKFKAGWKADETPADIIEAIQLLMAHFAENRSEVLLTPVRQELQSMPFAAAELLAPYTKMRL